MHTSGMGYGPMRTDLSKPLRCSGKTEKAYRSIVTAADEDKFPDLAAFCDAIAEIPLRFQPGTQWKYSYGMDVIGRVIEVASGIPLSQFLHKYVLKPLGMQDTTFAVPPMLARRDMSANYVLTRPPHARKGVRVLERVDGKKPSQSAWVANSRNAPRVASGGGILGSCKGGLVFSLRDLCRFCFWLASGGVKIDGVRFLKPSTARSLRTDGLNKFKRPLKGWDDEGGETIGWSPAGHVMPADDAMFMAGVSSWYVDAKRRLAVISLCELVADADPPGYDEKRDDLLEVVHRSMDNYMDKYGKQSSRKQQRAKDARTKKPKSKRKLGKKDGKKRSASGAKLQNTKMAKRARIDSTSSDQKRQARMR
jgi:CubicO group peptidase (beta-lactamase class C family)